MRRPDYPCAMLALLLGLVSCGGETTSPTPAPVAPKPAQLSLYGSADSILPVGASVSGLAVVVKDDHCNSMAGQPLTIVAGGGGTITGAPTVTAAGTTTIGTWTMSTLAAVNTLTISSGSLTPITLTVRAVAGAVSRISTTATQPGVGTVGTAFPLTLHFADSYGNSVSGAQAQMAVAGGGSLPSNVVTSDHGGDAAVPGWLLATARGTNTLTVTSGAATLVVTVVAQSDKPDAIRLAETSSDAPAGTALSTPPTVTVRDRYGNGVPRQSVTFAVTAGGGSLNGPTVVITDTNGVAVGPSWVLGKRNVAQQLGASAGALSDSARASIRTAFKIQLRFYSEGAAQPLTAQRQQAVQGAADRLTAMLISGAPPLNVTGLYVPDQCLNGTGLMNEVVDGIVIYVGTKAIDGFGGVAIQSYPCVYRPVTQGGLPAVGVIVFDSWDLDSLSSTGYFEDIATHEMMHVLGFGYSWPRFNLTPAVLVDNMRYSGSQGIAACQALGGTTTCANDVPVESSGSNTVAGLHWRGSIFGNELMTPLMHAGAHPLSALSIRSMADMGYGVNAAVADSLPRPTGLFQRTP